ncbi:uncharacterized protein VP01_89g8 [Puccinia sorghi]|uniref:Uncharacterized protein n=1 Tax=Puccinia sorghi TaxID=27349 RepID=A0A0L6U7W4_9BASI|nr:uncharacterized protein VP01_89g8 [Puccinia sorghi]
MLACTSPFVFLLFTAAISLPDASGWTSAGEVEFSTVVQGWSAIPWAFSKCRSIFEQRPPASQAIQAIATLASSTELVVSKHSSCKGCRSLGVQSSYYLEFEQIIRQIFLSWQSVLLDGSQKYAQQWKSSIGLGFRAFSSFLNTVYNMCSYLQIDLSKLFRSINIKYQLFLDVQIDLAARLKLNANMSKTGLLPHGSLQSSISQGKSPETNTRASPTQSSHGINPATKVAHPSGNYSASGAVTPPMPSGGSNRNPANSKPAIGGAYLGGNYSAPGAVTPPMPSGGSTRSPQNGKLATGGAHPNGNSWPLGAAATLGSSRGGTPSLGGGKSVAGASAVNSTKSASGTVTSPTFHVPTTPTRSGAPIPNAGSPGAASFNHSSDYSALGGVNFPKSNPVAGALAGSGPTPAPGKATLPTLHHLPVSAAGGYSRQAAQPAVAAQQLAGQHMSALVAGWSSLPSAFNKAQLTLQSHPSMEVSLQAIASLQATVQATVSVYGSCSSCSGLSSNSVLSIKFKAILTQIFTSWQTIITTGQVNYGAKWRASTNVEDLVF